ncbi:hypothetical protein BX666DRAFT_2141541 [Dichotomocladium elegans]|nr:hypothetical protein BX666DRAFT_2141541 [Dichotomocladium elegans]
MPSLKLTWLFRPRLNTVHGRGNTSYSARKYGLSISFSVGRLPFREMTFPCFILIHFLPLWCIQFPKMPFRKRDNATL